MVLDPLRLPCSKVYGGSPYFSIHREFQIWNRSLNGWNRSCGLGVSVEVGTTVGLTCGLGVSVDGDHRGFNLFTGDYNDRD